MPQLRIVMLWLTAIGWSAGVCAASPSLSLGQPLTDALAEYRKHGINVVSTTGLVSKRLRVTQLPDPAERLETQIQVLLAPHHLELKHLDGDTWFVTRNELVSEASGPDDSGPPPGEPYQPVMEELVVSASHRLSRVNQLQHQLDRADLRTIPSVGGDTLRAIASLPGAATSGVAASHRFRGGDSNEVLYLIESVPLLEPFHLRAFHSVFTALNPAVIEGAEVFTSGFPAEHGGKVSGLVALDLVRPSSPIEGSIDLNTLAAGINAGGAGANASWLVSARHSTIDKLLTRLDTDYGEPEFHDELIHVNWAANNKSFSLGAINTNDEIRLNDSEAHEEGVAEFDYQSVWSNASIGLGDAVLTDLQLLWLKADDQHAGALDNPTDAMGQLQAQRQYDVVRLSNKWIWTPGAKNETTFGWLYERQRADFTFNMVTQYGPLAAGIRNEPASVRDIRVDRDGLSVAAYLSTIHELTSTLSMQAGLRYDLQDIDPVHDVKVSPRVQFAWVPAEAWRLLIDVGRYVQHQNLFEIQIDDGLVELQPPQSANQVSLSVTHIWKNGLSLRTDLYYKDIDDPWRRFDNVYNPWVLLPELHADRYEVVPSSARATGIEATLSRLAAQGISWDLSYSLSDTQEKVGGRWYAKPWNQRHAVKLGVRFSNERWDAGLQITYRSGWPATERIDSGSIDTLRNQSDLPAYGSVDLHLARRLDLGRLKGEIYLDVTNALNRVNTGGYEYQLINAQWHRSEQKLLPLFPTLGFRLSLGT